MSACLALIYMVHFHSGVLSLHDPLWAPTRHPTTTCVYWPMPLTEELCWQLVSPCRRAHVKQQPEMKPERAEAKVHDPNAQTGLYCPASHQSLAAPPTQLCSVLLSPVCPKTGDYDDQLVNMPIKVLFVLHKEAALSQLPGGHVSGHSDTTDYLGAMAIWVSQQVSLWVCVAQLLCVCTVSLFWILFMPRQLWRTGTQ